MKTSERAQNFHSSWYIKITNVDKFSYTIKKKSQIRRSGQKSNTEQAQLLMKYNTKFHREREKEKKKHYLVSEIWSFRTFAIVPTNNTNTTTKQRPTHFIDTAIVNVITALSLSLYLCLQKKKKKKTRILRIIKQS